MAVYKRLESKTFTDIGRGLINTLSDSCDTRLVRKRNSRHLKPKILKGHLQGLHRVREGDRARGDRASRRAEWSENKEL